MLINNANPCQRLQEDFAKLSGKNKSYPQGLPDFLLQVDTEKLREWEDKVKSRSALYREYKRVAAKLVSNWDHRHLEGKLSSSRIEFDSQGRMTIKGDLNVISNSIDYFPSLINAVEGKLTIVTNSLSEMDFLQEVGSLEITSGTLSSMDSLKTVANNLGISDVLIKNFPCLEEVGGDCLVHGQVKTKPVSFPRLKKVGGIFELTNVKAGGLQQLEAVGSLKFMHVRELTTLPALKKVEKQVSIDEKTSDFTGMPALENVGEDLKIRYVPQFQDLSSLKTVGGDLVFDGTKVVALPELVEVGKFLVPDGRLESIPNLTSVGTDALLGFTRVTSAPALTEVGRGLYIEELAIDSFEKAFPALADIGTDRHRCSVYTTSQALIDELEDLRGKGAIQFGGKVVLQ